MGFAKQSEADADRARRTLAEVGQLRGRVRSWDDARWVVPASFGLACLGGAVTTAWGQPVVAALWWPCAAPVAMAVIARRRGRAGTAAGVRRHVGRLWVAAVAGIVVVWVAAAWSAHGDRIVAALAWPLAVGLGYVAVAVLEGSVLFAACGATAAAAGTAVGLAGAPDWSVELGVGTALLACGLEARRRR